MKFRGCKYQRSKKEMRNCMKSSKINLHLRCVFNLLSRLFKRLFILSLSLLPLLLVFKHFNWLKDSSFGEDMSLIKESSESNEAQLLF